MKSVAEQIELESNEITIPPGGVGIARIDVGPYLFRGGTPVVSESIKGSTKIILLFVENKHQLPKPPDTLDEGFDCRHFGGDGLSIGMTLDVCNPDGRIRFFVKNNAKKEVIWSVRLTGKGIKGEGK